LAGGYRAVIAHHRVALNRSRGRKPIRLASDGYLWSQVQKLLKQQYSPEQIAGILPRMFPDDLSMRVSHETIYTALYAMPRGGELRSELLATLRQARKARRPRARGEDRRGEMPNMTSIHQRPPEIDERVIPGHWEGDLIKDRHNASAVGNIVERTSLFVSPPQPMAAGNQREYKRFTGKR
jgi:IS30 family transposase